MSTSQNPGSANRVTYCSESVVFFFSSRRRHTRCSRDWSSDVCSSDLKAAYEALQAYAPGLPELTTVFITHSHWDHVGGHRYFRRLNPRLKFYARNNYTEEIADAAGGPAFFGRQFFGERYDIDDVRSFKPDVTVDRRTELRVGGTRIELIPVEGGETHDAMFIDLTDLGVLFVGDFIMPYLGAPFVEEGDLQGLLDAIDRS